MNTKTLFPVTFALLTGAAFGQVTRTWVGADANMATATNWSASGVPSATLADTMLFNGSGTANALTFPGTTFNGTPGLGGITVAAAQTSALSISNSSTAGSVFRLTSNANVTVDAGAGALTFGASGNSFFINLGNANNSVNTFTNNSSNTATISSLVQLNASGGGSGAQAAFAGTGDWLMAGSFTSSVSRGVIKNGTGRLTLSNTANAFTGGLTINGGTVRLGANQVITDTQTVTVNAAGTLDLNGFNETISGLASSGTVQNEGSGTSTLTVGSGTFTGTLRNNSGAGTGVVALTKTGTGTLTLSGTNSYTGLTTVSAGTLALVSNLAGAATVQSTATLSGEVGVGGNLTFSSGANLTLDPVTAGSMQTSGNLSLAGTVNVGLTKSPLSTAPFTVLTYAGTLTGGAANLALSSTGYRTPIFNDTTPGTITLEVGSAARTWNGGAAWDVNTASNWVEGDNKFFQLDAVTFGTTGAGSVAITGALSPSSITVNSTADYTFTAAANNLITGSTGLTKSGTGTLTLGGVNTFTGPININGGTLKPSNSQALGANGNTITIASGGALDTNGLLTVSRDYAAVIAGTGVGGTGAILNSGAAHNSGFTSITLSADATIGGTGRWDIRPITAGAGVLNLAGFTLSKTGTNVIAIVDTVISADGQIDINQGVLALSRNTISGAGSINVNSTGILRFENNTTGSITKPISVDGGTINVLGNNFTVGSAVTVTNTATIDAATNLTLTNSVSGTGSILKTGAGALVLAGNVNPNGTLTLSGGTTTVTGTVAPGSGINLTTGVLQVGANGTAGSVTGPIINNGSVVFDRTDASTYSGAISGTGFITKQNTGVLTLEGASTYTGTTTINGGSLKLGAGNDRLPIATTLTLANTAGANFDLNGLNQEVRALTGGGTTGGNITNTGSVASTLSVRPTAESSFAGQITGDVILRVLGDKTTPSFTAPRFRLTGTTSTFIGGIVVDGGTLLARQDGSLGAVPSSFVANYITLQNSGTLLNDANGNTLSIHQNRGVTLGTGGGAFVAGFDTDVTVNSIVAGAAGNSLSILPNNRTVIFTGANTYEGQTLLTAATSRLSIGNGGTSGTLGSGNVINNGLLTFNRSDASSYGGEISGTGALTKLGAGELTLAGNSTYTGATTITAGTLLVNGSLGNTAVSIANGARLGGNNGFIAGLVTTAAAGSIIAPGNSPGTLTVGSLNLTAGGVFEYELGTTSDLLEITGALSGVGVLTFNFSDAGGIAPATPYTLFTFGSQAGLDYSDLIVGTLPASFSLDPSFGNGGWQINSGDLQVQFIPEPSITLLAGLGLLLAVKRRRA